LVKKKYPAGPHKYISEYQMSGFIC